MITSNDISKLLSLVEDGLFTGKAATTDDTPTTVYQYTLTPSEVILIEAKCVAMKGASDAYVGRKSRTFFYDGATVTDGAAFGSEEEKYFGTLSTCAVSISNDDNVVSVVWTGEAASDMQANVRVKITRLQYTEET